MEPEAKSPASIDRRATALPPEQRRKKTHRQKNQGIGQDHISAPRPERLSEQKRGDPIDPPDRRQKPHPREKDSQTLLPFRRQPRRRNVSQKPEGNSVRAARPAQKAANSSSAASRRGLLVSSSRTNRFFRQGRTAKKTAAASRMPGSICRI